MKLKFTQDGIVSGEVVFKKGEIYEISDEKGSATRWIKRGAIVVEEEVNNKEVEAVKQEVVEEVVIKPTKKENKKENKSSKQG